MSNAPVQPNPRDFAFDFAKGLLVEVMVLFHSVQYFLGIGHPLLNYLAFVTGAFTLLSGMVATQLYRQKYPNQPSRIARRLVARGFKLLLVFLAFNLLASVVLNTGKVASAAEWARVFLGGNKRLVVYEMLVPIAYTLLAGALLGLLPRLPMVAGTLSIAGLLLFEWTRADIFNLNFLVIGLIGVWIGALRAGAVPARRPWLLEWGAYAGLVLYFVSVAILPVDTPLLYAAGVVFVVESSLSLSRRLPVNWPGMSLIGKLGQYSLVGYLAQIIILQLLRAFLGVEFLGEASVVGALVLCNALLLGMVYLADFLRRRVPVVDRAYRLVFA